MSERPQPSEQAEDCFIHGLAHLIDEVGERRALEWAAQALLAVEGHGVPPQRRHGHRHHRPVGSR